MIHCEHKQVSVTLDGDDQGRCTQCGGQVLKIEGKWMDICKHSTQWLTGTSNPLCNCESDPLFFWWCPVHRRIGPIKLRSLKAQGGTFTATQ